MLLRVSAGQSLSPLCFTLRTYRDILTRAIAGRHLHICHFKVPKHLHYCACLPSRLCFKTSEIGIICVTEYTQGAIQLVCLKSRKSRGHCHAVVLIPTGGRVSEFERSPVCFL